MTQETLNRCLSCYCHVCPATRSRDHSPAPELCHGVQSFVTSPTRQLARCIDDAGPGNRSRGDRLEMARVRNEYEAHRVVAGCSHGTFVGLGMPSPGFIDPAHDD